MTHPEVSVGAFFEHARHALQLELCAGQGGLSRALRIARIQKPGLALAGYTGFVHHDRVQILGRTELDYLATFTPERRAQAIAAFIDRQLACVLVTKGLPLPTELVAECERTGTPLLRSSVTSSEVIRKVLSLLDELLSPRISLHGVLLDVNGMGVLITGASGIGKSECALDLVTRGHRLVADDVVDVRQRGEELVGQPSPLIKDLIEIRGLGILNIAELYGVAATRDHKRIELHVELEAWLPDAVYDRTGLESRSYTLLGVSLRSLLIPVQPGRNVAGLIEVAVRNRLLELRGHHAPTQLNRRIQRMLGDRPDSEEN